MSFWCYQHQKLWKKCGLAWFRSSWGIMRVIGMFSHVRHRCRNSRLLQSTESDPTLHFPGYRGDGKMLSHHGMGQTSSEPLTLAKELSRYADLVTPPEVLNFPTGLNVSSLEYILAKAMAWKV